MINGVVAGKGNYMASGEGFYTFREERKAEGFSYSRGRYPAVLRLSMAESVYTRLLNSEVVTQGPYYPIPGVTDPGTTEVVLHHYRFLC